MSEAGRFKGLLPTAAERWYGRATLCHGGFPPARIAAERERSVSVCLPARDEAATIGPILERLLPLLERGAVDQVVVVDESTDGTGDIALELGAEVHRQSALCPEWGPVEGKGDAMWRALSVLTGDVICFLDADSEQFDVHFACGLVGPVAGPGQIHFAKGFYRRPFRMGGVTLPTGGGRVTELTARPLLNLLFPELAGFLQPLAGEIAVRRELIEQLPLLCGYAVDVGLLIDVWREVGLGGMVQVDLDVRQNQHQPLADLGPMAYAVACAVASRAHADGRLAHTPPSTFVAAVPGGVEPRDLRLVERPPMALVRAAATV